MRRLDVDAFATSGNGSLASLDRPAVLADKLDQIRDDLAELRPAAARANRTDGAEESPAEAECGEESQLPAPALRARRAAHPGPLARLHRLRLGARRRRRIFLGTARSPFSWTTAA